MITKERAKVYSEGTAKALDIDLDKIYQDMEKALVREELTR
jgi:hypothetical protein